MDKTIEAVKSAAETFTTAFKALADRMQYADVTPEELLTISDALSSVVSEVSAVLKVSASRILIACKSGTHH